MKINRIDHIGIIVDDIAAATEFFLDLGLELMGTAELEGQLLSNVVALDGAKTEIAMFKTPDGQTNLELAKFYMPPDEQGIRPPLANTLGIRHIAFAVEGIEAIVDKLKKQGVEFFSEIQNYENTYKLCYIRGPEGIILELAEEIQ